MPTKKPRITITMSEEQLKNIEKYQHTNKIKNQTQAILSLINAGFKELGSSNIDYINYHDDELIFDLVEKYTELDPHGKDIVDIVLQKEHERIQAINKKKQAKKSHLEPIAAHNDSSIDDDELDLMKQDIDNL